MKKTHLLSSLLLILFSACQLHHSLRLDEEEVKASSLEELLKREGLDETKTKEEMGKVDGDLLRHAAKKGWASVVHKLLLQGVDVESTDKEGTTPLHWAAINGHTEVAGLLLDKGAQVNAKTNHNSTPLHWAAVSGHAKVAELLLDKGAQVNARGNNGYTPLGLAAFNGRTEVTNLLRSRGGVQ